MSRIEDAVNRAFETWKNEVFDPFCKGNADAHDAIFTRLDRLNGWRNKLLGMALLLGFAGPVLTALAVSGHIHIVF